IFMIEPIPNGRKLYNKVTSHAKPLKNNCPPNIFREPCRCHPNLKHCAINTKLEVEAKTPSVGNPS
ncbi:TPA: hypothetical protein ACMDR3_003731, partial [Vibrio cholerae]